MAADAGSTGIKFQVKNLDEDDFQFKRLNIKGIDAAYSNLLKRKSSKNSRHFYHRVRHFRILNSQQLFQPNYLPILNSQYLSGINYLNAASAAAVAASTSKSAPTSTTSPDKAALLEKLSNSLNQSLVSEGISSP